MKSSTTPSFWRAYRALTPEIQSEARKAYQLWQANPRHPSLHFERKGDYWSVPITRAGERWPESTKTRFAGFGLDRTTGMSDGSGLDRK